MMRRAEIAMRAGRAEQELRQAGGREDASRHRRIRSDALDYLTIFPDATARFRRLIEQIDHRRIGSGDTIKKSAK